jgi:hypothetical protein
MSIQKRLDLFYELNNNKWFHIMNWTLEIIKTKDRTQKCMLAKYGSEFFTSSCPHAVYKVYPRAPI